MSEYKHYSRPKGKGVKLHLGCGDYWFEGYTNIDFNIYAGTDMIFDIRKGLPYQPEVVEIIECYEVIEHLNKHEVNTVLDDWYRVLIPGGRIKISVPDMDGLIALYATNKKRSIEMIYGLEDHPHHKQGYTVETLTDLFAEHKFSILSIEQGSVPERPDEPQLLLECEK